MNFQIIFLSTMSKNTTTVYITELQSTATLVTNIIIIMEAEGW